MKKYFQNKTCRRLKMFRVGNDESYIYYIACCCFSPAKATYSEAHLTHGTFPFGEDREWALPRTVFATGKRDLRLVRRRVVSRGDTEFGSRGRAGPRRLFEFMPLPYYTAASRSRSLRVALTHVQRAALIYTAPTFSLLSHSNRNRASKQSDLVKN